MRALRANECNFCARARALLRAGEKIDIHGKMRGVNAKTGACCDGRGGSHRLCPLIRRNARERERELFLGSVSNLGSLLRTPCIKIAESYSTDSD